MSFVAAMDWKDCVIYPMYSITSPDTLVDVEVAGFHLTQVEHLVDEVEQDGAIALDDR